MNNIVINDEKNVFDNFIALTKIPHGSGNMEPIAEFMREFAKKNALDYREDECHNFVFVKPATPGYENAPAVMIQGHLDMVCEADSDHPFDFTKESLKLEYDGNFLRAKHTTLGGDDGIAVAYGMSLLTDETLKHPKLYVVFTTDEETGMYGAIGLDCSDIDAKYMINIDSENEHEALVSCAGGLTMIARMPLAYEKKTGNKVTVSISGLNGGHSGTEIDKNRVNAMMLMTRYYLELRNSLNSDFSVISISGGNKDNAIPRECTMEVLVSDASLEKYIAKTNELFDGYKDEFSKSESGLSVNVTTMPSKDVNVLTKETKDAIFKVMLSSPCGVVRMSTEIQGLVETSVNLGIVKKISEAELEIHFSIRSSVNAHKLFISAQIADIVDAFGGKTKVAAQYPAWEYKKNSKLQSIYKTVYTEFYGYEPKFSAIHAGLECGILSGKLPNTEMISIGPDMFDIHTPKERLSVPSAAKLYKLVKVLLENIR